MRVNSREGSEWRDTLKKLEGRERIRRVGEDNVRYGKPSSMACVYEGNNDAIFLGVIL
jgi:hypothetical protein